MGAQRETGRRSRRKARADCRKGRHRYGSPQAVVGGIYRQTCTACGAVTIDISQADDFEHADSQLFASPRVGRRR